MKRNFSRIIASLLVFCMILGLAACSKSQSVETGYQSNSSIPAVDLSVDENPGGVVDADANKGAPAFAQTGASGSLEEFLPAGKENAGELVNGFFEKESAELKNERTAGMQESDGASIYESLESESVEPAENFYNTAPDGEYNEGIVLVKVKDTFDPSALGTLKYIAAEPLYKGSKWYTIKLADEDKTEEVVDYLTKLDTLEKVDYDYIMKVDGEEQSVDISGNTYADQLTYLETLCVKKGWESNLQNGKTPGGSPDVVIAVIDTGVDYNHLDLRGNIWVNTAEIPDNGKDDDGNGYIDDINGWDCVGDDNDPMDDNGHGTHVAGIAAAENNKLGTVGVAYNCKIMALKAGNSSGHFNGSDIAEAVQYAYMNGASVINMSFGGASISVVVEEALKDAYNQCVLVAAAGNNGLCNQPGCPFHPSAKPFYPASLQYVIGVMSCNAGGTALSYFSNFDHYPYNNYEYDVVAPGENIQSTWPNNKYASLSGTSMACPTVAGIAAVLRSTFSDREKYSTKYITSQIVNTVSREDNLGIANLYAALTELPKPYIYNIYDRYIFDNVEYSPKNNGNGVIDAGETIRLAIELQNRGGAATNVVATIDTIRHDDPDLTDPYFTIVNDTIRFSDVGTFSVRDCGKLYDNDGNWIGTEKYFEIIVSEDCPNSYLASFNIHLTYENGLDEADDTVYEGEGSVLCNVNRGYHLAGTISEDTVFEADRLYIISSDVVIPEGVTVTFKEGCEIQFYDNREYYNSPSITVYGTLNFEGTKEKMIKLAPDGNHSRYGCSINNFGVLNASYLYSMNLVIYNESPYTGTSDAHIEDSYLRTEKTAYLLMYEDAKPTSNSVFLEVESLNRCYLDFYSRITVAVDDLSDSIIVTSTTINLHILNSAINNIFYSRYFDVASSSSGYDFGYTSDYAIVKNNIFSSIDGNAHSIAKLKKYTAATVVEFDNNAFSEGYRTYNSQVIEGYYDSSGNPTVDVYGSLSDASLLWPHVVSVELFNADGEPITTVGREEIKVRVTFSRAMDTSKETYLSFGTVEPYADYRIDGEYISDTVWEGTYTLKAQIENGQNFLKVNNACAAEDPTKTVFGEYQLHEFTIDTTEAMSMNLQALAQVNGIRLTWAQDDYDTLLGYNIYRSEEKDGNFVKLNPTILLSTDDSFLDENAEPGKTYWYTYTVVLSDFTESNPAGKVMATAMDTMSPSLYHTPVNQGYENNNLVISATASDNVAISNVTLYYRTVGATEWKTLSMVKQNDKYSATIFGSDVTLAGIEYYIAATDGRNTVWKGSAEAPYTVVVKSADSLLGLGDVDGNGAVSSKDALMLIQCINGDLLLSDDQFKRADLNKDNILSSIEALRILQYVNGKVTTLEM